MDQFRVGFYGSLVWLGATIVALVFTAVLLAAVFQASFGAASEAARTGRGLPTEEIFQPVLERLRPWFGVSVIFGGLGFLGQGLVLVGLNSLRIRLGKTTLMNLVVALGIAAVVAGIGTTVWSSLTPPEENFRKALQGGFGAEGIASLALAAVNILFLILLGVVFLIHRPQIPGPSLATGILFVLSFLGFLLPIAAALLAVIFHKLSKASSSTTPS